MARLNPARKPAFFWQGLLILLPVAIMAVVAGTAIIQDRASVEREAQQRAAEILRQINQNFADQVADNLAEYEEFVSLWRAENLVMNGSWAGVPGRPTRRPDRTNQFSQRVTYTVLSQAEAGPIPHALLVEFSVKFLPAFNDNGTLRSPPTLDVPKPPGWRFSLSPEQLAAWESLCHAAISSNNSTAVETAFRQFTNTAPSPHARANAEFLLLQNKSAAESASNAIPLLLRFCDACGGGFNEIGQPVDPNSPWLGAVSESGIALSDLALAETLKRSSETALTETLWHHLETAVYSS